MSTLVTRISDLATRSATEFKSHKLLINNNAADLSALTTTAKTNLVAALNEHQSAIASLQASQGAVINDTATTSTTQTYSINKISSLVTASINALVAGAPTALDTLKELADSIGDDANFAGTVTAALGNRLRFDLAQTLTAAQMLQGQTNLGAVAATDIGTPDTNFVTVFQNGLI